MIQLHYSYNYQIFLTTSNLTMNLRVCSISAFQFYPVSAHRRTEVLKSVFFIYRNKKCFLFHARQNNKQRQTKWVEGSQCFCNINLCFHIDSLYELLFLLQSAKILDKEKNRLMHFYPYYKVILKAQGMQFLEQVYVLSTCMITFVSNGVAKINK